MNDSGVARILKLVRPGACLMYKSNREVSLLHAIQVVHTDQKRIKVFGVACLTPSTLQIL